MKPLKILMAASEAGPYVRTGGLGDVMAALPSALAGLGHEIKVVLPRYRVIDGSRHGFSPYLESLEVPDRGGITEATVERAGDTGEGVEFLFIGNSEYFGRSALYVNPKTGKDFNDNDLRFAFYNRAVLELARRLEWAPDIIHVHDWQASLTPVYLKVHYAGDPYLRDSRTVLTIHNLEYQGLFDSVHFTRFDLPDELLLPATGPLEFYNQVNLLKGGIMYADKVTTVSDQYAREIQASEEFGCGLEGVLSDRAADLSGIVNGVDYSVWSPKTDRLIPQRYSISNLSGKQTSRVELMGKAGLPMREKTPLIGMVTRLTSQKGIDLVIDGAEELFGLNLQMIILGTGDEEYHKQLKKLERTYPYQLKVYLEFNDELAHQIQAGSDMFLMPSRYEPCGLNQMYGLKYGTVPIVRAVGGLADTISDYQPVGGEGTGFVFVDYSVEGMLQAVSRAVRLFQKRPAWTKLMKAGMRKDFSWATSAGAYVSLYESLTELEPSVR